MGRLRVGTSSEAASKERRSSSSLAAAPVTDNSPACRWLNPWETGREGGIEEGREGDGGREGGLKFSGLEVLTGLCLS